MNQFDVDLTPFIEGGPYISRAPSGKKRGYKNKYGDIIIEPQFDEAGNFSEGLARVMIGDRWGYIDRSGNFVIEPKWTRAFNFTKGRAEVSDDNGIFLIDKTGKVIQTSKLI
jgi:hypothetical protein